MHNILSKAYKALEKDDSFDLEDLYDHKTADRIADLTNLIEMADKRRSINSMKDMLSLYNRVDLNKNEAEWIVAWTFAYNDIRAGIIENVMREMPFPPKPINLEKENQPTIEMEVA